MLLHDIACQRQSMNLFGFGSRLGEIILVMLLKGTEPMLGTEQLPIPRLPYVPWSERRILVVDEARGLLFKILLDFIILKKISI